jgi:hypothetical protein
LASIDTPLLPTPKLDRSLPALHYPNVATTLSELCGSSDDAMLFHFCDLISACKKSDVLSVLVQSSALLFSSNPHIIDIGASLNVALARSGDRVEILKTCLVHGAELNSRDPINGMTVLMCATVLGQSLMVSYLLQIGCDISIRDNAGRDFYD